MYQLNQNQTVLSGMYKSLFDFNPNLSYAFDKSGKFILANDTTVNVTGYSLEELLEITFVSILKECDRTITWNHFLGVLNGERKKMELTLITKTGEEVLLFVTAAPIVVENQIIGVAGTAMDITEFKALEENLRVSQNQLQNIFNSVDVCVWSLNAEGTAFLQVSPACKKIYGYSSEEFLQNASIWRNVIHPHDIIKAAQLKQLMSGRAPFSIEYRILSTEGEVKWVHIHTVPVFNEHNELVRTDGVLFDISQQRKAEEALKYLAYHDTLTDLPNRRMFESKLQEAIQLAEESGTQLAIMYLDLDQFKMINDTLGHGTGDELLQIVAKRLELSLRSNDLVSRQGGDEFAVLLKDITDLKQVQDIAGRLLNIVTQPLQLRGNDYRLTTSIGISLYPDHEKSSEGLIKQADQAMYLAKESGKNMYQFYHLGMIDSLSRKVRLTQDLSRALQRNELSLYYQPIVDTNGKGMVGFEALLRWEHESLGHISPVEFIPIAEESGLILSLGEWIIRTACLQGQEWRKTAFPNAHVTVNISTKQLEDLFFMDNLKFILRKTNTAPHQLKIEVTESAMMKNPDHVAQKLQELRDMGIEILLDDFGTGYSSLSYLKKLPFHTLKIDRSFVQDIGRSADQETIIRTIVGMASHLRMQTVAEGVEKEDQLRFLQNIGCYNMQGYLFSKPLPLEQVLELNPEEFLTT